MRKTTLLWLVLAAFCGTVLFHTSQRVHDEREKLAALETSIGKEEESLRVLSAEWSYLNQPARLEKLAKTYLNMAPLKGSQFIKVEDIPLRSAAPEVAEATTTAPAEQMAEEKPAEKKPAKPHITTAIPSKPIVNIRKPAAVVTAQAKPARPAANTAAAAANPHSFSDLMKNLHAGVE
jgi:cell division protein FtsL